MLTMPAKSSIFRTPDSTPFVPAPRQTLVLVADDHDDSRAIARLILESGGFQVIEARTGAETVALTRAERPTAILLDIVMPVLDGWTAARWLRADPSTAATIIIALTALASDADRERTFAAGCDEVLTKPIHPRALLEVLLRYTRPARGHRVLSVAEAGGA